MLMLFSWHRWYTVYEVGCLVILSFWHFTGWFHIHVHAHHFAVVLWIPAVNNVPSASISTERTEIEIYTWEHPLGFVSFYSRLYGDGVAWQKVPSQWSSNLGGILVWAYLWHSPRHRRLKGKYAEEICTEFGCVHVGFVTCVLRVV